MTTGMAHQLLRVAASRWPDDIATDMHHEWRAELYAIANESRSSSLAKSFGQLRFAFSLAVSRPGGEKQRIGIRERSKAMKPVLAMLGLGTLVGALALAPLFPVIAYREEAHILPHLAMAVVLVAIFAGRAARWMSKSESRTVVSPWALPLLIGVGALLTPLVTNVVMDNRFSTGSWVILVTALVWIAALIPLVKWVKGAAERGSRHLACGGGVLGGLAIVYLISIPLQLASYWVQAMTGTPATQALVWFPELFWGMIRGTEVFGDMWITHAVVTFMMATVFIVWYLTPKAAAAVGSGTEPEPDSPTSQSGAKSKVCAA